MTTLTYILVFSFISSVASLFGGVLLLLKQGLADKIAHLLASFAAGALLGTAFFDLLPEATEASQNALSWVLGGIVIFFLMERFIHWFHHHHEHAEGMVILSKPVVPLIIFGDSVHNFIDGLVVGGAFLVDTKLGVVTALAVAAHEIPQEIGDFGILLNKGVSRSKVFTYNFLSSLTTMVGALLVYFTASALAKSILPILLAVTAGFFIYIAASDLIPEIHSRDKKGFAVAESALLLAGIVVIWAAVKLLEG
jgi:zinc and cadmium transporter